MNATATAAEFTPVERVVEGIWTGKADLIARKLKDMNKRLARLGAPAATVEFGPVIECEDTDPVTGYTSRWTEFETVTVTGSAAKIAGWTPIASLDHTFVTEDGDDEAWVSMFPGAIDDEIALPAEFRTIGRGCDHCGTDRLRKTTVVFVSDDDEWINVGTSCLRDFIGITPATILWLAESFASFDDDEEFRVPREAMEPDLISILRIASALTDTIGFVPSRELGSTKEMTLTVFDGRPAKMVKELTDNDEFDAAWAASADKAEAIKTWVLEAAETSYSDYIANAALAIRANRAAPRTIGLLVSLPHVFNKNSAAAAEAAAIAANRPTGADSTHIGEIGDKVVLRGVTIVKSIKVDTMYGTSLRVTGITEDGDKVTTFGSGNTLWDAEVDGIVEWRGTVKSHNASDEYGVETEFNRVKILDMPSDVDFTKVATKGDRVKITVTGDEFSRDHALRFPDEVPEGWVYDTDNGVLFATVTKVGKRDDRFRYTTNAPIGIFAGADIEVLDDDAEFPAWTMTDTDVKRELRSYGMIRRSDDPDRDAEYRAAENAVLVRKITKWAEERGVEATDEFIADTLARYETLTAEEEAA